MIHILENTYKHPARNWMVTKFFMQTFGKIYQRRIGNNFHRKNRLNPNL